MPSKSIIIAQRDPSLCGELAEVVSAAGFTWRTVIETSELIEGTLAGNFDAVLLDSTLADGNGLDVCSEIRNLTQLPVLFVVPPDGAGAKLQAFEAGADDFIVRPYDRDELVLRINAVLRRVSTRGEDSTCVIGPSVVNLGTGQALRRNRPVALTGRELQLLRYLYERRDRLVPREELLREVWRYNSTDTRTVDMHIATLRRKLEADPRSPRHLMTVRRHGYVFRDM